MSNREALRKLSRKFPALPEIEKVLDSLANDSDLTIAIVGGAILEASLETLITSVFTTNDAQLIGQIFLNKGPLVDFNAKILICHALGIISPTTAEGLHSIKSIRNVFAHSKLILSFDHELIEREIKTFKEMSAINAALKKHVDADEISQILSHFNNKLWFLTQTRILLYTITNINETTKLAVKPDYVSETIKRVEAMKSEALAKSR